MPPASGNRTSSRRRKRRWSSRNWWLKTKTLHLPIFGRSLSFLLPHCYVVLDLSGIATRGRNRRFRGHKSRTAYCYFIIICAAAAFVIVPVSGANTRLVLVRPFLNRSLQTQKRRMDRGVLILRNNNNTDAGMRCGILHCQWSISTSNQQPSTP